jgi:hypothetical protein
MILPMQIDEQTNNLFKIVGVSKMGIPTLEVDKMGIPHS